MSQKLLFSFFKRKKKKKKKQGHAPLHTPPPVPSTIFVEIVTRHSRHISGVCECCVVNAEKPSAECSKGRLLQKRLRT